MISVRMVGRGGQGIKSAAHIIGTAAFLGGHYVQDQPLYGAERRGAPVTAFIRISDRQILDRGPVIEPTLLVVADDSLLGEKLFDTLEGVAESTSVFVNTSNSAQHMALAHNIAGKVIVADLTRMAEELLDRPIVSVAVAGAVARLIGQSLADLEQALTLELGRLRIDGNELAQNIKLAREAYDLLLPIERVKVQTARKKAGFVELQYHGPVASACTIVLPGNTIERQVGAWSKIKPLIDYDECTKCRICFVYCPDSAISIGKDDFPLIDYDKCKGCDICYAECPVKAISLVRRDA